MSDFHEVRFPTNISYGSTGGPQKRTDIITLANGFEERNSPWAYSRHRYNVGYGIRAFEQAYKVVEFFAAREGQLYGFRYKDWADYKSGSTSNPHTITDQVIGVGDGTSTAFQLVKTYKDFSNNYTRQITKPLQASVIVAIDNNAVDRAEYFVDSVSGIVLFATAPADGATITAGFEFDVPVRFDTDWLPINLSNFEAGEFSDIPLIEVRVDAEINPNLSQDGEQFILRHYGHSAVISYVNILRDVVERIYVEIDP